MRFSEKMTQLVDTVYRRGYRIDFTDPQQLSDYPNLAPVGIWTVKNGYNWTIIVENDSPYFHQDNFEHLLAEELPANCSYEITVLSAPFGPLSSD